MAQPPAYNREKDFVEDFGSETDHAALNAEFDRASNAINDIRANLALMQADDGKIRALSITTDSLAPDVLDYVQASALAGANAVADAATAIACEAQDKALNAVETVTIAHAESQEAVATAGAAQVAAQQAVSYASMALDETALIDEKVAQALIDSITGVEIPGLSVATITGTLGYVPYNGEANPRGFATQSFVALQSMLTLDENGDITTKSVSTGGVVERYTGATTVTPSRRMQSLATSGKAVMEDITITETPYLQVSNATGETYIICEENS